jgi:hypothetical protein
MKRSALVLVLIFTLFLGGAVGTAPAKAKKDAPLSKLFCQARYVYVQAFAGDPLNPDVVPEDREAAIAVQQRVEKWGRYILVYQQRQADLVFAVRAERKGGNRLPGQPTGTPPISSPRVPDPGTGGSGNGGPGSYPGGPATGRLGAGQNPGAIDEPDGVGGSHSGGGPPVGGAIVPPGDLLAVYMPPANESLDVPIWKKSEDGGLQPPMHLFAELADAVDDACPNPGTKSH